jgi:hypothetical protein
VRARFPEVDVVRIPYPTGGPPSGWNVMRAGILHAIAHYDFQLYIKMDTDALITKPGFSETVLARLAGEDRVGIAGSCGVRCDGQIEDSAYHALILDREMHRSRVLRSAFERAIAAGWRAGDLVQGGTLCITPQAAAQLHADGYLHWRRPWSSQLPDDLLISMFAAACGYSLLSIGGPDGIFAVGNKYIPLTKEQIVTGPWAVAHSTREDVASTQESALRAFFRQQRESWRLEIS